MPVATPCHADGSPVCQPHAHAVDNQVGGVPLTYDRATEDRALLSAKKAWWHPKSLDPTKDVPPVGAQIWLDGQPKLEFRRVPVIDAATDEVIGSELTWVDVAAERAAAAEAAALAELKAQHAARKRAKSEGGG